MRVCVCVRVRACVRACVRAHACMGVRDRASEWVSECVLIILIIYSFRLIQSTTHRHYTCPNTEATSELLLASWCKIIGPNSIYFVL